MRLPGALRVRQDSDMIDFICGSPKPDLRSSGPQSEHVALGLSYLIRWSFESVINACASRFLDFGSTSSDLGIISAFNADIDAHSILLFLLRSCFNVPSTHATMSAPPDLEGRPRSNEQTPLLAEQQPAVANEHEAAALLEPQGDGNEEGKRGGQVGWWLWRIFWVLLAAAILAVFIKGWIDARDTDVRTSRAIDAAGEKILMQSI